MVICPERGADLRMAQLLQLPLTVSCFSKIQIGFTLLVPAHLGSSPGKRAVKRMHVRVPICYSESETQAGHTSFGRTLLRLTFSNASDGMSA